MAVELRDLLTAVAILATVVSMVLVSRNARRATAVQLQNTDLTRIRDLRAELKDTEGKVGELKAQISEMEIHLGESNRRQFEYAQRQAEMIRYARMGVTMEEWLARFDDDTPALGARQ